MQKHLFWCRRYSSTRRGRKGDLRLRTRALISPVLAIAIYCVLAVFLYGPTNPAGTLRLPQGGMGDPAQMAWFLAWTPFAIAHGQSLLHSSFIDPPSGINFANNTFVPALGFIAAPITHFLGPIASLNLLFRLAFTLSATTMFFVLRTYCSSPYACFFGGLLYGFGPYLVSQSQANAHLNLAFAPIPPLLYWCFDQFAIRKRNAFAIGALIGVAGAIQFLISPEILSDCLVVALPLVVVLVVAHRHTILSFWRYYLTAAFVAAVVFLVGAGFDIGNLIFGSGHVTGAVQPSSHLQTFSSDLLSPVVPNDRQLLFLHSFANLTSHFVSRNPSEQGGYLGIPLILAAAVCAIFLRRHRLAQITVALALVAFVGSLGSRLTVANHRTSFPLPEAVLTHVPLLRSTTPARFALEVMLFLGALCAIGLDQMFERLHRTPGRQRPALAAGLAVGVAAVLVPLIPQVPLAVKPLPWSPALIQELRAVAGPRSTVLTYPYPSPPYSQAMLWQAQSDMAFRLMGGYATVENAGTVQYWPPLLSPSSVQEFLSGEEAGLHSHYAAQGTSASSPSDLCQYVRRYDITDLVVWKSAPRAAVVEQYFDQAFGAPTVTNGPLSIWQSVLVKVTRSGACALAG